MTPSTERKSQIQAIVSVFETGHAAGDPSAVALLTDGAGISYGIHQATDRSGALDAIVRRYLDLGGERLGLLELLARLDHDETSIVDPHHPPAWVRAGMDLLAEAGQDPLMVQAQHEVFDRDYWAPAVEQCQAMELTTALALAAVYDTCIHSGPRGVSRIRNRFPELPPARGGDERQWVRAYVKARRAWLASRSNPLVQRTVYRMDTLHTLIDSGAWDLDPPFLVRGQTIE